MKAWLELGKPRISLMVALTAALGWTLAGGAPGRPLWELAGGVAAASAAAAALNQYLERREDALMARTRARPLPSGRLPPRAALTGGLLLSVAGPAFVWARAGALAGLLTAATVLLYVLGYTPMKKLTPQATWLGAAAGAMPPLIGWAAASGGLHPRAWALFAIQFIWQIPHFLALFWLYRAEYAAAGFRVMPVVHPDGGTTAAQIALHSFALLPATMIPLYLGMAGSAYAAVALPAAAAFLVLGARASWTLAAGDARRLFTASLAYLPLVFGMLVLGGA